MKRPKVGRPRLEKGTARTEVLSFKLYRAERAELEHAAGAAPLTAWARETLLAAARRVANADFDKDIGPQLGRQTVRE